MKKKYFIIQTKDYTRVINELNQMSTDGWEVFKFEVFHTRLPNSYLSGGFEDTVQYVVVLTKESE